MLARPAVAGLTLDRPRLFFKKTIVGFCARQPRKPAKRVWRIWALEHPSPFTFSRNRMDHEKANPSEGGVKPVMHDPNSRRHRTLQPVDDENEVDTSADAVPRAILPFRSTGCFSAHETQSFERGSEFRESSITRDVIDPSRIRY